MATIESTRLVAATPVASLTGVDLSAFDPKRGGKYSPNLYAFLMAPRNKSLAVRARVFQAADKCLWLGYMDDNGSLIGARMSQVLCYGRKVEVFCHVNVGPLQEVTDFWQQYAQDGRCAIDRAHTTAFLNDDTRWSQKGSTRHCQWCRKVSQRLTRTEQVKVVTDERWVNA
jgi:hypothetical protein